MNRQQLSKECSDLIKRLREKNGISKSKMALEMMIDPHTISKWESGQSEPSVTDFILLFDTFGESALRSVLDMLYPDTFKGLSGSSSTDDVRKALVHYFQNTASDRMVRDVSFLIFGDNGSNIEPQLQECMMVEHLPIEYRYTVAEMIDTLWRLAEAKGQVMQLGHVMPDVELFRSGLKKARDSIIQGKETYTTSMEVYDEMQEMSERDF